MIPGFDDARRVLFVHAHPDDESISTGGTIARLVAEGVKVAVVTATRGERGEVVDGPLKPLEGTPGLAAQRVRELETALRALGVVHHRYLRQFGARGTSDGPKRYVDSGMRWGADGRAHPVDDAGPDAFASYNFAWAVGDLQRLARRFKPDVVVGYDLGGGYGHPDHVQARLVAESVARSRGIRFAEIVPDDETAGADAASGGRASADPPASAAGAEGQSTMSGAAVTRPHAGSDGVAVVPIELAQKRAALAAHASQLTLTDDGFVLSGGQHHVLVPYERFRFLSF